MSTEDERPKEIYDDGEPSWKTNLEDDSTTTPAGGSSHDKESDSPADLKRQEEATTASAKSDSSEDALGKGFTSDDSNNDSFTSKLIGKKLQLTLGGGIGAFIGLAAISLFMFIMPLKVLHVVNNMQDKYFGSSESAVEGRIEHHFNRYIADHVLQSLNGEGLCKNTRTIDRSCVKPVTGTGPAAVLYRGWQDAKLETKMAEQYGFEIAREPNSNNYTLRVDGKVSNIDVEGFRKNPANGLFQATGGREDIRRSVRQALAGETRWKKVMYRYKVGRLMERKYGIRRCVFYCQQQDNFDSWKTDKRNGFGRVFARRVLQPRSETVGLALECILSTSCDNDPATTNENEDGDLEKKDKLQKNIDKFLAQRGTEYTADTVESIAKVTAGITESGGFGKYIVKEVITKVTNETIAKVAGKAIPIVGWIDMVAQMTTKIKTAGPKFKKWAFAVNSAGMVSQYAVYRSHADEIKNGKTDIELAGSVADSLNGMEQSPLYTDVMGTGSTAQTTSFFPKALAEGASTSPDYLCDDGKPVPAGKKICNEESLKFDNLLTDASDLFRVPPLQQLGVIADGWNASAGKALALAGGAIGSLVQSFPGIDQLNNLIAESAQPLLDQAAKIIPNPFSDTQSGGRSFNLASGGANVAGNHNAEFGLGGKRLSNQEVADIRTSRMVEKDENFKEKSLYARLFDKDDTQSFVSQVAISMPIGTSSYTQTGLTNIASNPIGKIMGSFSSIFSTKRVLAETAEEDPFGVPQYGYPVNDPSITAETPEDCDTYNKEWAEDTTLDPESGQEIHNRVNLCLLDQAAIGSAGGYFTSEVLTEADLGSINSGGSGSTASNSSIYFLGDSLTVGMKSSGLDSKLQGKGWSPTSNGVVGRKISGGPAPDGITQLNNDKSTASTAGTIVMALGTNHFGETPEVFNSELKKMYDQIKAVNASASIMWVNYAGTGQFAAPLQQKSALLGTFASQNNIKIIDWATPGQGLVDPNDVHPYKNYPAMTDIVVNAIGQAPVASSGSGFAQPNANAIDISQTSEIPGTGGIRIATSMLPQITNMLAAARKEGVELLPISSGWRDPAKQVELRKQNCPDWQNSPPGDCRPVTAKPGTSNHERGQAIDFGNMCYPNGSICPGNPRWEWLRNNASKYGFLPLSSEAWHWSLTGN